MKTSLTYRSKLEKHDEPVARLYETGMIADKCFPQAIDNLSAAIAIYNSATGSDLKYETFKYRFRRMDGKPRRNSLNVETKKAIADLYFRGEWRGKPHPEALNNGAKVFEILKDWGVEISYPSVLYHLKKMK